MICKITIAQTGQVLFHGYCADDAEANRWVAHYEATKPNGLSLAIKCPYCGAEYEASEQGGEYDCPICGDN